MAYEIMKYLLLCELFIFSFSSSRSVHRVLNLVICLGERVLSSQSGAVAEFYPCGCMSVHVLTSYAMLSRGML